MINSPEIVKSYIFQKNVCVCIETKASCLFSSLTLRLNAELALKGDMGECSLERWRQMHALGIDANSY